jgi:integrase
MRIPHYLIRRESGGYQFRKRIPLNLRPYFGGRKDFRQSLRTHCMNMANAKAIVLSMRYDTVFDSIRLEMANPSIHDFPHLLQGGNVGKYTVKTPDGTEITVDPNNPADHAAAMDYVRTKQAHEIDMENLRLYKAEVAAKANAANLAAARTQGMEIAKAMQAGPRPAQKLKAKDAEGLYEQDLDKETRVKTKDEKLKAVRIFLAASKVECIDDITRPHVADWIRSLKDKDGNGDRTIQNKVGWLKLFLDWAIGAGYFPKGDNPATGHKSISKRKKRLLVASDEETGFSPFTLDEIAKVMAPESLGNLSQDMTWALLLASYSGARVTEICQLYINDVFEADGVWAVRIDTANPHQHIKTESSRRKIPLHPDLLKLGLLERIEALKARQQERLFPAANLTSKNGAGDYASKRFGRHLEKIGLKEKGRILGFHSIRNTFIHTLAHTKFEQNRREYFVGHEIPTVDHKNYVKKYRPDVLLKDLKRFWKPPIDLQKVGEVLKSKGPLERIQHQERARAKAKPKTEMQNE